jgi:hypothetical protein
MSGRCTAALLVVRKWYNCSVAATTSPFAEQLYTLAVVNTFLFGKERMRLPSSGLSFSHECMQF